MGKSQSHTSESFTVNGVDKYATFEDDWFAKGASRYAYQGKIFSVNGWWFERGQRCVVKLYKEEYCAKLNEEAWRADKRASLKAQEMAELFNATYINDSNFARIEVLIPIISQIKTAPNHVGRKPVSGTVPDAAGRESGAGETRADVMVREGASVAIEYFLRGRYVEFLSNTSLVNTEEKSFVPVAFSHFTFHESKGEILVTDLQGVYNQKSYVFTDPAVHSMDKRGAKFGYYGPTDLGVYGVMKFFYDHKCNSLCKGLLKPDMSNIPDNLKGD
ncbi:alpha-protein kinase 1-like [Patiria miniata]|uniref:Alpha-type protein kinase domain-containing protein n=1 Tax=Patiria miniata TaxID=46514 RepID=A0A914AGQ9_PATMI|nr:alpha-protein kinase 1-like [Patiria miniata]